MRPTSAIFKNLTQISLGDPADAVDQMLKVLVEGFRLTAASLYLCTPHGDALCLRAQIGLPISAYDSFELGLSSLPGSAVRERRTIIGLEPAASSLFTEKDLPQSQHIAGLVVAPLELRAIQPLESSATAEPPELVGVLCLYPARHADIQVVESWMKEHSGFVAQLYGATVDRHAMHFRRKTVDRVAFKGDIGSLAHSFLTLVQEELSVEAASLWTVDTHRHLLYLQRSTKLAGVRRDVEIPGIRLSDPGLISRCFGSGEPIIHTPRDQVFRPDDINEKLGRELSNGVLVPVPLPAHAKLRTGRIHSAGVLTLLNHYTQIESIEHPTAFSWEDIFLAEFACEVISVLLYQMIRTGDHESDYERLMHGARTSIQSAKHNLQLMEDHGVKMPPQIGQPHLIPNAIDWLEDLESQMNREDFVKAGELEMKSTALYGDVLAKLSPMVSRMRTRARNPTFTLVGSDGLLVSYRQLPRVWGDARALNCVFRNLIDNSMKYARIDSAEAAIVSVEAVASADGNAVTVSVRDNGIGIPNDEAELIFENGFRGERANARQPQGVGRGLFECKMLLELMDGTITLTNGEDGAEFLITLQTMKGKKGN